MSASVFPARAGMSPTAAVAVAMTNSVPRASGDEPTPATSATFFFMCSPRERG